MLGRTPTSALSAVCGASPSSGCSRGRFDGRFVGEGRRAARAAVEVAHHHFLASRRVGGRERRDLRFREHLHRTRLPADLERPTRQEAAAFDRHRRAALDRSGARRDLRDRGRRQGRAEERQRRAGVGFVAGRPGERGGVVRREGDRPAEGLAGTGFFGCELRTLLGPRTAFAGERPRRPERRPVVRAADQREVAVGRQRGAVAEVTGAGAIFGGELRPLLSPSRFPARERPGCPRSAFVKAPPDQGRAPVAGQRDAEAEAGRAALSGARKLSALLGPPFSGVFERPRRARMAVVVGSADQRGDAVRRQGHAATEIAFSGLLRPEQLRSLDREAAIGALERPGRAAVAVVLRSADKRLIAVRRQGDGATEAPAAFRVGARGEVFADGPCTGRTREDPGGPGFAALVRGADQSRVAVGGQRDGGPEPAFARFLHAERVFGFFFGLGHGQLRSLLGPYRAGPGEHECRPDQPAVARRPDQRGAPVGGDGDARPEAPATRLVCREQRAADFRERAGRQRERGGGLAGARPQTRAQEHQRRERQRRAPPCDRRLGTLPHDLSTGALSAPGTCWQRLFDPPSWRQPHLTGGRAPRYSRAWSWCS